MYRTEVRYVCDDGTEWKTAEEAERHALAAQIRRMSHLPPNTNMSEWIATHLDVIAKLRDWPADAKKTVDEYLAQQNNKEG